jgi:dihydrofolate reductase
MLNEATSAAVGDDHPTPHKASEGRRRHGVAAGTIARQCPEAGLLDEVAVDLVPVVMGKGRPYFGELSDDHPYLLGDPTKLIQGERSRRFPVSKG